MSEATAFAQDRATIAENRRRMFARLGVYVRRNRRDYVLGVFTTIAYAGFFVAFPVATGWCVQALAEGLAPGEVARRCALLAAIALGRSAFRYGSRIQIFNAAREIEYEIRNDLFAHLMRLPQSFYFRWRTGDLMSRCVNDLTAVRLMLGAGLLQVAQTPVLLLISIGTMLALDPTLALMVLVPVPLFLLVARSFGRAMHSTNLAVQVGLSDMSSHLQETISGVAVVKAYAMEATTRRRFDALAQELYQRQVDVAKVTGGMMSATGMLPMLGMVAIFWIGGRQVMNHELTLANFFTFTIFNYELTQPLFFLGWVFNLVQRGTASMQRIDEVLGTEPSIADREAHAPVAELRGEIEFRGLSFRYAGPDDRGPALQDVSLRIPAGGVIGIVGPVGSGKSTLASLIPRLYEVGDGMLFLDGVDVNRIPIATLRRAIAMVPQDAFLFSMSLADNVAYGLAETKPVDVLRASGRAQLAKDVPDLPHGYDTVVGERGVMLSGGQRQRTALARALALDPRILILDDTLSAVDAETEAAIQAGLREVFAGRTVVVVASRVSTVREADQIVVLGGGRVVEQGTHAELIANGGLYARLAQDQEAAERRAADLADMEAVA